MKRIKVGTYVETAQKRWLRAGETGVIAGFDPNKHINRYLVQFETPYPGGGIEGDKLYLSEADFTVITFKRRKAA